MIEHNKTNLGAWLTVGHPQVAEAIGSTGFYNWLAVDIEHSTPSLDQAAAIFLACDRWKMTPFVRTLGYDPFKMRSFLDAGAKGVIIPVVENAQQLRDIAEHLYYPPKGKRGVCLSRMNNWGDQFEEYYNDFEPKIIAQIESKAGVDNIEQILEVEELDGIFVGPYDLSGSLGIPGQFENSILKESLDKVVSACQKTDKLLGIHVVAPEPTDLQNKIDQGFNFIAYGTDMICLRHSIMNTKKQREQR